MKFKLFDNKLTPSKVQNTTLRRLSFMLHLPLCIVILICLAILIVCEGLCKALKYFYEDNLIDLISSVKKVWSKDFKVIGKSVDGVKER